MYLRIFLLLLLLIYNFFNKLCNLYLLKNTMKFFFKVIIGQKYVI